MKNKKLIAMIICVSVVMVVFILALLFVAESVTEKVIIAVIVVIAASVWLYGLTNAFIKWAISKYFRVELHEEKDEA